MNVELIDVRDWTRFHADRKHPFWWGILGLIAIEATVVASFLVSYFYLWIVNIAEDRLAWPPPGTELPPLLYPSINVGLLVLCALSMYYGGIVMKQGRNRAFVWSVVVCCGAGTAVLYLRWLEFNALPFAWHENAYASFVWVLTGFHFLHVASAVVGTAVIGWLAARDYYTEQRRLGIQVDTMYWYFVSAAWIPVYFVLYWTPRLA